MHQAMPLCWHKWRLQWKAPAECRGCSSCGGGLARKPMKIKQPKRLQRFSPAFLPSHLQRVPKAEQSLSWFFTHFFHIFKNILQSYNFNAVTFQGKVGRVCAAWMPCYAVFYSDQLISQLISQPCPQTLMEEANSIQVSNIFLLIQALTLFTPQ